MTSYRPIDAKREEFRKYLERCGVMDALTRVLVMLYEEPDKPEDALEYVRVNLGDTKPSAAEIEQMRADLEQSQKKINDLQDEICQLRKKLYGEDTIIEDIVAEEEPQEELQDQPTPERESIRNSEEAQQI